MSLDPASGAGTAILPRDFVHLQLVFLRFDRLHDQPGKYVRKLLIDHHERKTDFDHKEKD